MTKTKIILLAVLAFIVVVVLGVGMWRFNWFLATKATQYQAHIFQHSYGTQTADKQELQNLISTVNGINVQLSSPSTPTSEKTALTGQKQAEISQACSLATNIDTLGATLGPWVSSNCTG